MDYEKVKYYARLCIIPIYVYALFLFAINPAIQDNLIHRDTIAEITVSPDIYYKTNKDAEYINMSNLSDDDRRYSTYITLSNGFTKHYFLDESSLQQAKQKTHAQLSNFSGGVAVLLAIVMILGGLITLMLIVFTEDIDGIVGDISSYIVDNGFILFYTCVWFYIISCIYIFQYSKQSIY